MNSLLLRVLGVQALARVGAQLSGPTARATTVISLIIANLLPILAVIQGAAGVGDVFALYWLENVVVGAATVVKILSARGSAATGPRITSTSIDVTSNRALAGFFCLHYGIFTFVHGVFTIVIVVISGGLEAGVWYWLVTVLALVGSSLISLGMEWFGHDQRSRVSPPGAMFAPYPRMLVLHVAVIAAFFFIVRPDDSASVLPVVILCGLKTLVDVALSLFGSRRLGVAVEMS